jgi:hypothetical protein
LGTAMLISLMMLLVASRDRPMVAWRRACAGDRRLLGQQVGDLAWCSLADLSQRLRQGLPWDLGSPERHRPCGPADATPIEVAISRATAANPSRRRRRRRGPSRAPWRTSFCCAKAHDASMIPNSSTNNSDIISAIAGAGGTPLFGMKRAAIRRCDHVFRRAVDTCHFHLLRRQKRGGWQQRVDAT